MWVEMQSSYHYGFIWPHFSAVLPEPQTKDASVWWISEIALLFHWSVYLCTNPTPLLLVVLEWVWYLDKNFSAAVRGSWL